MSCPNCRKDSHCGCRSCLPRRKPGEVLEVRLDSEIGTLACGHCGFAMVSDAWMSMEWDLCKPEADQEAIYAKFRAEGKMPGEKGYRPSFRAHWKVKLWRWRSIFGSVFMLLIGGGYVFRDKGRWGSIRYQLSIL